MKRFLAFVAILLPLATAAQAKDGQVLRGLFCNTRTQLEETLRIAGGQRVTTAVAMATAQVSAPSRTASIHGHPSNAIGRAINGNQQHFMKRPSWVYSWAAIRVRLSLRSRLSLSPWTRFPWRPSKWERDGIDLRSLLRSFRSLLRCFAAFTYICPMEGWLCENAVIDRFSRLIVGWSECRDEPPSASATPW